MNTVGDIRHWHFGVYHSQYLLLLAILILHFNSTAQNVPVRLSESSAQQVTHLENYSWRFHAGDSLQWANPEYNDAGWENIKINFGEENEPPGWNNFGWFRIWVKKEKSSLSDTWGMSINHDAASEIYLDGKKIMTTKELLQNAHTFEEWQHANFILQNSERLLQLMSQLLDLSRLESGLLEIKYTRVELVHWLSTQVSQFGSLAANKNIHLEFISHLTVLWIKGDVDKLEKIIQNLISNALKFTSENGHVKISLIQDPHSFFEIKVEDNGIGIAKKKQPYIFDRFYQIDASDTRTQEGTGIGLSLVKEHVLLLDRAINMESSPQSGTVFTVRLPYVPADKNSEAITPSRIPPQYHSVLTSLVKNGDPVNMNEKPVVLVVEDNKDLRDFIRLSLVEKYEAMVAKDGSEGIEQAFLHIPDLIITDLMMPHKNGYGLCSILKQNERTSHIPIIILTAKSDQDSKIQGIETGADAYMAKPFDKRELVATMDNLILIRKQLREKFNGHHPWLKSLAALPTIEQRFLEKVRNVIESRLDDEQFGAEQLGIDVGLSRTQLHRKLKSILNQSPGDLIRSIRMQRAHELLEKKMAHVSDVAYMVGYGNPANFSTSFSKHFGYSPSEAAKVNQ